MNPDVQAGVWHCWSAGPPQAQDKSGEPRGEGKLEAEGVRPQRQGPAAAHLHFLVFVLSAHVTQVLGVVGALDPHKHKTNQADLQGEGKLEAEGVRPQRQGPAAAHVGPEPHTLGELWVTARKTSGDRAAELSRRVSELQAGLDCRAMASRNLRE